MKYKIIKFFDDYTLSTIHSNLNYCQWVDGSKTFSNSKKAHNYKRNLETEIDNVVIFNALDNNKEFLDFTLAKYTNAVLISKTMPGGFYKPHFDLNMDNFSTTIFLNNPSDYSGGELCLLIDNKEEKFKLNAGYGVVYETGITHRVNTVSDGQRLACVFWTKSKIPDIEDIKKYRYYSMMKDRYEEKIYDNCYDFHYNLNAVFSRKCDAIMRKWSH